MQHLNRRAFLRQSAIVAGAAFVSPGCAHNSGGGSSEKHPPQVISLADVKYDPIRKANYKLFVFEALKRGKCTLGTDSRFLFYEDGNSLWTCDIMSTHAGDTWDGSITGGAEGYPERWSSFLFYIKTSYRFKIKVKNQWVHWDQAEGPNKVDLAIKVSLAEAYARLKIINFYCGC